MTLKDFLKRIDQEDYDKVIIVSDGRGWTNITGKVEVDDSSITLHLDNNRIFNEDI